jgi:hypothetical protein
MAITRPSKAKNVNDFIDSAPDASQVTSKVKGVKKGNKQQISLTIKPELLEQIDLLADSLGLSRASLINLAISRALEQGLVIDSVRS